MNLFKLTEKEKRKGQAINHSETNILPQIDLQVSKYKKGRGNEGNNSNIIIFSSPILTKVNKLLRHACPKIPLLKDAQFFMNIIYQSKKLSIFKKLCTITLKTNKE